MGSKNSVLKTKQTKQDKEIIKNNRSKAIENSKNEIDKIKNNLMRQTIENIKTSTDDESILVLDKMNKINNLIDISKEQLNREGLGLTKIDLITILILLDKSYASNIELLHLNTITSLNTMIRIIIYNPTNHFNTQNNNQELNLQIKNQNDTKNLNLLILK